MQPPWTQPSADRRDAERQPSHIHAASRLRHDGVVPDSELTPPFLALDFIYMPSVDVAGDVDYFTTVLGARLAFAIESFGTRVAMVRLGERPPDLLFAGHLEGERPI